MKYVIIVVGLAAAMSVCLGTVRNAEAVSVDVNCRPVEAVFARGSAQALGDREADRFRLEVEKKIPDAVGVHYYELGTESYGGHIYKPIGVDNVWNGNPLGAKFSSGYGFDYGASVDAGVGELHAYLTQRYEKCKASGTKYVLGGYSQGAQVVGQTLSKLKNDLRAQIVFVSLFGDPKLSLPEGIGFNPPACRGEQFSPWRRIIAKCTIFKGSLDNRQPYLPVDMEGKTGLWCYAKDFVCGSSKNPFTTEGHGTYGLEGNAIDLAVGETVDRLRAVLAPEQAAHLATSTTQGVGTTGLDVVFVIDTTGSMASQIEQARAFARSSAQTIKTLRGRVALVAYRDYGDDYTAKIISRFDDDMTAFQSGLDGLSVDGGGDRPEAALHGLMTAFDGLNWKDGATKAAVVLTDADFHNPDLVDGSTIESVAARSLEIDPVNVYPVVPDWATGEYQALADATSGQVIVDSGDTAAALTQALIKIEQRPTALLKLAEYSADPGQQITFDASDSYVNDAEITRYDWDFDGDGAFDQTTDGPVVQHTYDVQFDGAMQVRLTASNDTIASASAMVNIGITTPVTLPAAPTAVTATVIQTNQGVSSVRLAWTPSDSLAAEWVVSVNDVAVGRVAAGTTTIELTDVQRTADVKLSVAGVTEGYDIGDKASTTLAKADATPVTPPPAPTKRSWITLLIKCIVQVWKGWITLTSGR